MRKIFAAAALGAVTIGLLAPPALAEDFGNWADGCAGGWICFYETSPGGTAKASTDRDSNFANNPSYPNGHAMNDNVNYIWNRFVANISVQAYQTAGYGAPVGFCLVHGTAESPLSGISAFKSC
jgi:hypothetical protein